LNLVNFNDFCPAIGMDTNFLRIARLNRPGDPAAVLQRDDVGTCESRDQAEQAQHKEQRSFHVTLVSYGTILQRTEHFFCGPELLFFRINFCVWFSPGASLASHVFLS
jgi:hypothetical protein